MIALIAVIALLVVPLMTMAAGPVQFEQVGTFGASGEDLQLGGVGGMAVNWTGAGGVPSGTVYAATRDESGVYVARLDPNGAMRERWRVTLTEGPYERCGPESPTKDPCSTHPDSIPRAVDVDVDQMTGNVYVYNGTIVPGIPTIVTYPAIASEVISRFADRAPPGEATAASKAKVHESPYPGALAVNSAGEVFIFDVNSLDNSFHRLMRFKPQTPGNFQNYVYVDGGDIGAGALGETEYPTQPVTDAAGDIYVGAVGEGRIEKYTPSQPATPVCSFDLKEGGITSMTVNPQTGEVFYYTYKKKQAFQLTSCNQEGKFIPTGVAINVNPKRDDLYAMAYDPKREFGENRPAGVLYAGAPSAVPSNGVGKGEPGQTSLGYVFAPLEVKEVPPEIESESVSGVTGTSAQLHAEIDAKSLKASYAFEYLREAAYQEAGESFAGASEAPAGGATLEEGEDAVAAGATVTGLTPGTEYRFRAVVRSNCNQHEPEKVCIVAGTGKTFTTYAAGAGTLPDERAWELVSPTQKNGGQVMPAEPITSSCILIECKPGGIYQHFPMLSRADGNAVVYEGTPFGPGGATIENEYMAARTSSGWANVNLTPESLQSKAGGLGYRAFQASLGESIVGQVSPSLNSEAPPGFANLYRQPTAMPGTLSPLLTNANATIHRPPGSSSESLRLTFAGTSADLSRIFFEANDALIAGAPEVEASETNLYEWSGGELHLVNFAPGDTETLADAAFGSSTAFRGPTVISDNGSLAYFSSTTGQLYARVGGAETIEIQNGGKFLGASRDGSKVLLDNGCLYDLAKEECEDLTADEAEIHQGGFIGLAGQSEDLSHIYFVDSAILSEDANSEGAKAQSGKSNLYAWVEGALSFIGTLTGKEDSVSWRTSPASRMAEASPAGRYLAFLSEAPQTGFDNIGPCEVAGSGEILEVPCKEVFLYDSVSGELLCPSCNQANAKPLGRSVLRLIRGAGSSQLQPRYLTDAGRLYFDSQDSLVPGDSNGNVEDVYQYEPNGVGGCQRESGCVNLISAGRESVDSNFVTMDLSGNNVFFTTRDKLAATDKDDLIDLYDARVGGGFPLPPESSLGEQSSPLVPPEPAPVSPHFTGSGNATKKPLHCKKGQAKKNGRCVKKPRKHKPKSKRVNHYREGSK